MLKQTLLLVCLILSPALSQACQVPVFRYALERWAADAIKIIADKEFAEALREEKGNFEIQQTEDHKGIAVYLHGIPVPFYRGEPKAPQKLFNSATRKEVFQKLTSGTSAVWILLKSGRDEIDSIAEKNLAAYLKEAEKVYAEKIAKKKEDKAVKDELLVDIPLQVKFEYISLERSKEESFLVNMLLSLEPDLREIDQPMAFAVYGRGRCLPPLIGKGISRNNIVNEDCSYLCGDCTCEVKEQNPGVDLLFAQDWDEALKGKLLIKDKELPALKGIHLKVPQSEQKELKADLPVDIESPEEGSSFPYVLLVIPIFCFLIWRIL